MGEAIPSRVGPYEVVREIGRGGMGVVHLARDTRLERDVAVKALPEELADDPDRLARFEREAKVLASLNHPSIASIYGLEEVDGRRFLILEFVPGETLDTVLGHGPMPAAEALAVAKQIAEAIESAHENGIIHRDLKPANIKFAEGDIVKVLDFGLAKAFDDGTNTVSASASSPTYIPANTPTMPGVVLGTAGYLSPEQARGRHVDKRTDVFSFGCVLYEMLTGKTIFPGETVTDSLGATLHSEPDWSALPADTPPTIALLLRRCLAKDRRRRLHDIADARVEIEDAISDPTSSTLGLASAAIAATGEPSSRSMPAKLAAAFIIGVAATAALTWGLWGRSPEPAAAPGVNRLGITIPHAPPRFGRLLAAAPDGRSIVVTGQDAENDTQLYVRRLDQRTVTPIGVVSGFSDFTVSPDSKWVAYRDSGELRRVAIDGGPPTTLAEVGFGAGMHWCDDGWIYIGSGADMVRVPENGGAAEAVASIDVRNDVEPFALAPCMIRESNTLLYTVFNPVSEESMAITAVSLSDGTQRVLMEDAVNGVVTSTGHLLFLRGATLMAVPFDASTAKVLSQPVPVAEGIRLMDFVKIGNFGVSADGTLFSVPADDVRMSVGLFVVDRAGERLPLASFSADFINEVNFAPDGRRFAVSSVAMGDTFDAAVWIIDVEKDIPSLLTADDGNEFEPVWSPDGAWIYYVSMGAASSPRVLRNRVDTSDAPELVHEPTPGWSLYGVLADGAMLLAGHRDGVGDSRDLVTITIGDESVEAPWLATAAHESGAAISPDARWVAYHSDETGEDELYIRSAAGDRRQRVSSNGIVDGPFWAPDGTAIYFTDRDSEQTSVMAVTVTGGHEGVGDAEPAGGLDDPLAPLTWEPAEFFLELGEQERLLGVHPDGRLVISAPLTDVEWPESFEIEVTQNFLAEVEKRAPVEGQR